MTGMPL